MPSLTARLRALAVAVVFAGACYTDPQQQLDQAQQLTDLADILNDLTLRTTELQFTLDSLRGVVARQDSTIARLANLAGVDYRTLR
ncbi:MAG: hypothetical protein WD771_05605 [Gemmatimonadaceae bacterium]